MGANTADRLPSTTIASPRRTRHHCCARSSSVSWLCRIAIGAASRARTRSTSCGVSEISGTSSSTRSPSLNAFCAAARYTSVLPLAITPCSSVSALAPITSSAADCSGLSGGAGSWRVGPSASSSRRLCRFCRLDGPDPVGHHALGRALEHLARAIGEEHHALVVFAAEADVLARDVVGDDRLEPFALQLLLRMRIHLGAFGGEPDDEDPARDRVLCYCGYEVADRLELQVELGRLLAADLAGRRLCPTEGRHPRGHHQPGR